MISNFLFHRVNPKRDPLWDPMDVTLFERCVKLISENYQVVLLEEQIGLGQTIQSRKPLACIMFDDGFKDNIEFAAPILHQYRCKASFYVATDCIDNNRPPWTTEFDFLFANTFVDKADFGFDFLPESLKTKHLDTKEKRLKYAKKLKPFLKKTPDKERSMILKYVHYTYSDVKLPPLMMDWEDLKVLKSEGHYIGAHSASHPVLALMNDEILLKKEIEDSGKRIHEKLGHFPLSFAYPFGSFDERIKNIVRSAGYQLSLAVNNKVFDPKRHHLFEIPRIELYNEPWWKTKWRISSRLSTIKSVLDYWKKIHP